MAMISVSFDTTPKQDAKLARILSTINAARVQQQLAPFGSIEDYFRFVLVDSVKSWVQQQTDVDARQVGGAYESAPDSVRAQIQALLGL